MSRFPIVRAQIVLAMFVVSAALGVDGQAFEIGIIDFYGVRTVSASDVRGALTFKEGDTIVIADDKPRTIRTSEERLARLPGIAHAHIEVVCCDSGRVTLFVGVQERGASDLRLRPAPAGAVRLPADVVLAGEEYQKAHTSAVQRGDTAEDRSKGHSLMHDPAARTIQESFVVFAKRDLTLLRKVLRSSSDPAHRALAAQVLGYAEDKQSVVDDLVRGMSDPDGGVRNNAMRALMVFGEAAPGPNGSVPRIPLRPFIELLHSLAWTDRNKASGALMALTARRDQGSLAELRKSALTPLVEMARWKSAGHAFPAFMILARIAGYSDEVARGFWENGNREVVIKTTMGGQ